MSSVKCSVDGCGRRLQPVVKVDPRDRDTWLYPECDVCFRPACDNHSSEVAGRVVCDRCCREAVPLIDLGNDGLMTTPPLESPPTSPLRFLARALSHRNYRLYFAGQGVSLIGTWMTRLATNWLVYRLSGAEAALLLGLIGFAGQIPTFFLAPFAGVLVDRWSRHRLLVVTQLLALVQSALLAVVAFRGEPGAVTLWQVGILSFGQGVINAFDMPARQVLLLELIDRREDLPNAIALNSFLVNGARLVGPSLAGLLIGPVDEGGVPGVPPLLLAAGNVPQA